MSQRKRMRDLLVGNNAGQTTTATLIFMALHDKYRFNKKRLEAIKAKCNEYNENEIKNDPKYTGKAFLVMRDKLESLGIDIRLQRDFTNWIVAGLGLSGKEQRIAAKETIEMVYVYLFMALRELYNFGRKRMQWLQRKIKFYAGCIREGTPRIEEYMKCLSIECGQHYPNLTVCEEKYGELKIYG